MGIGAIPPRRAPTCRAGQRPTDGLDLVCGTRGVDGLVTAWCWVVGPREAVGSGGCPCQRLLCSPWQGPRDGRGQGPPGRSGGTAGGRETPGDPSGEGHRRASGCRSKRRAHGSRPRDAQACAATPGWTAWRALVIRGSRSLSRATSRAPPLRPDAVNKVGLSQAVWRLTRSETARATVGARSVRALPLLGFLSRLVSNVGPRGCSRTQTTAAAENAHVRGALPSVVPDVPARVPAASLAHVTRRPDAATSCPRGQRALSGRSSRRTRRSLWPIPGTVCRRDRVVASWGLAVVTRRSSPWRRRGSAASMRARAPARLVWTAGAAQRSATPSRVAVEAIFWLMAGRGDGLVVLCPGARSAPRVRARGRRRRRRARGARLSAGETEAGGSRPPRRRTAMVWAALFALLAVPPCRAVRERACPRTQGLPGAAQRSARQYQVNRHAAARTLGSRSGALALRRAAGVAVMCRCTRVAPAWSRMHTYRVRAWRSIPQEKGCGFVENRLEVSCGFVLRVLPLSAYHRGVLGRGPQ